MASVDVPPGLEWPSDESALITLMPASATSASDAPFEFADLGTSVQAGVTLAPKRTRGIPRKAQASTTAATRGAKNPPTGRQPTSTRPDTPPTAPAPCGTGADPRPRAEPVLSTTDNSDRQGSEMMSEALELVMDCPMDDLAIPGQDGDGEAGAFDSGSLWDFTATVVDAPPPPPRDAAAGRAATDTYPKTIALDDLMRLARVSARDGSRVDIAQLLPLLHASNSAVAPHFPAPPTPSTSFAAWLRIRKRAWRRLRHRHAHQRVIAAATPGDMMRAMQQAKRSVSEAAWLTMPRDRKTRLVHEQLMQSSRDANARSARVAENHANDSTSLRKRREPHGSDPQSTACAAPPQRTVRFATTLASDLEANADRPPLKKQATQSMHDTKGRSGGAYVDGDLDGLVRLGSTGPGARAAPRQNPKPTTAESEAFASACRATATLRAAIAEANASAVLPDGSEARALRALKRLWELRQSLSPEEMARSAAGPLLSQLRAHRVASVANAARGVKQAWKAAVAEAAASETAVVHTMSEARPSVTDTEKDGSAVDGDDDDDVEGDQARLADEDADAGPGDKLGGDEMKLLKRRHRAAELGRVAAESSARKARSELARRERDLRGEMAERTAAARARLAELEGVLAEARTAREAAEKLKTQFEDELRVERERYARARETHQQRVAEALARAESAEAEAKTSAGSVQALRDADKCEHDRIAFENAVNKKALEGRLAQLETDVLKHSTHVARVNAEADAARKRETDALERVRALQQELAEGQESSAAALAVKEAERMEEKERFDVRSRDSAAKRRDEKRHLEKRIADAAARAREERQKFAQQLAEAATSAEAEVNAARSATDAALARAEAAERAHASVQGLRAKEEEVALNEGARTLGFTAKWECLYAHLRELRTILAKAAPKKRPIAVRIERDDVPSGLLSAFSRVRTAEAMLRSTDARFAGETGVDAGGISTEMFALFFSQLATHAIPVVRDPTETNPEDETSPSDMQTDADVAPVSTYRLFDESGSTGTAYLPAIWLESFAEKTPEATSSKDAPTDSAADSPLSAPPRAVLDTFEACGRIFAKALMEQMPLPSCWAPSFLLAFFCGDEPRHVTRVPIQLLLEMLKEVDAVGFAWLLNIAREYDAIGERDEEPATQLPTVGDVLDEETLAAVDAPNDGQLIMPNVSAPLTSANAARVIRVVAQRSLVEARRAQLEAMRAGFATVHTTSFLRLFSPGAELRWLFSGEEAFGADALLRCLRVAGERGARTPTGARDAAIDADERLTDDTTRFIGESYGVRGGDAAENSDARDDGKGGPAAEVLRGLLERLVRDALSDDERRAFLRFTTGLSAIPCRGVTISVQWDEAATEDHLPQAATCTAQLFVPLYSSEPKFQEKMRLALSQNDGGFDG